jgi:Protein of unknown function (DUF2924)
MSDALPSERLSLLPTLSRTALNELWKELFETSKPPSVRRELVIEFLSYRLQEQSFGSLSAESRSQLRRTARSLELDSNSEIVVAPTIKPGTRLVRQWRSQVHLVTVVARGFEYEGICYDSLSEIARLITGTRWSGPLFFGLRSKKSSSPEVNREQ